MSLILQTERLALRKFTFDDAPFIVELLNTPGWLQFIGDRNVRTEEQAKIYLTSGPLKSYDENGFGLSMVETTEGTPIGMCGLLKREVLDTPDIGFAFLPGYNGKGYAYEIASATMNYAKNTLGIKKISGITQADNVKSIQLLEKLGLKFIKTITMADAELLLYTN